MKSNRTEKENRARWNAENTILLTLKLHNENDADILDKLASVENRSGYIKALISADIAANGDQN